MRTALNTRRGPGAARSVGWLGFYGLVLAAWAGVLVMAARPPWSGAAGALDPAFWDALCIAAAEASPPALVAMWALMSAAMMAPTLLPALRVYDDMAGCGAADPRGFVALVAGYLGVWLGFSVAGAAAQAMLSANQLVGPDGASRSLWLTAALLAAAGLYQFSPLKAACLSRCRQPLTFFLQYWRPGAAAALTIGARLGLVCLGCCWALMLLGFVGGAMNLLWMAAATLFMTMEKLPAIGARLTGPAGAGLIIAAGVALALAFDKL